MSKNINIMKYIRYGLYAIMFIILIFLFNNFFESFYKVTSVKLGISGDGMGERPIEVFYAVNKDDEYSGENMVGISNGGSDKFKYSGSVELPAESAVKFRIDLGNGRDKLITIKNVEYKDYNGKCVFNPSEIAEFPMNDADVVSVS